MKIKSVRFFTTLFISFVVLTTYSSSLSSSKNNFIEYNGVKIFKPSSYNVNGKVSISGFTNKNIKIMVKSPLKKTWYDVNLKNSEFSHDFWLTDGKGEYKINIMKHVRDNLYSYGPGFTVNNISEFNKYLMPAPFIESDDKEIINLAKKITFGLINDLDKARAFYDWVTNNISYDMTKYRKHLKSNFSSRYGALNTFRTGKGVCFDYSTLVAALGRATGMQVKVIEGNFLNNGKKLFHSWNEIYISEEDRWINIDTTFADVFNRDYFDNKDFSINHIKEKSY